MGEPTAEAIRRNVEVFGLFETARRLRGEPPGFPDPFDRLYGTDTETPVPVPAGGLPPSVAPHAVVYAATATAVVDHVLAHLDLPLLETTFVDVGCGKGRVVMLAARLPFRRVLGVEASPLHCRTARRNLARFRRAGEIRCPDVAIVEGDATQLVLPEDGPVAIFLYNPFQAVLAKLFAMVVDDSLRRAPRPLRVAYVGPYVGGFAFDTCDRLALRGDFGMLSPEHSWRLYGER
jgi:SAM-dependent methyltransferase